MKSFLFYLLMLLLSIMIYRSARAQYPVQQILPAHDTVVVCGGGVTITGNWVQFHNNGRAYIDTPKAMQLRYSETRGVPSMDSIPFLYIGDGGGLSNPNLTIISDTIIVANWFRVQGVGQARPAATRENGRWIVNNDTLALEFMYKQQMILEDKYNAARKILLYMKTDGTITNWKKWRAAVNEYMKLVNN